MANNENLKPLTELSKEDAKKIRSKGGKARAKKIKELKSMKEMLDYLLKKEIENKKGEKASTQEAITIALIKQALNGNVKAFEVIRDTIGEKPTQKQEITGRDGEPLGVQKVFILPNEVKEMEAHINEVIK